MFQTIYKYKNKVALLLLVSLGVNVSSPLISYALTSGPIQSEYTSYESADARDMVSLITGDFQYNIPILEVPGPEGNFNVPLFYHSSIKNEDESSWVGLGWNINVGCIARSVLGFPDDYFSTGDYRYTGTKPVHTGMVATGGTGWTDNFGLYQKSWDSEKGYSGSMNILDIVTASWGDKKKTDVGVMGIHGIGKGKGVNHDELAAGVFSIYSLMAGPPMKGGAVLSAKGLGLTIATSLAMEVAFSGIAGQNNSGFNIKGNLHLETKKESNRRTSYKYWYQNGLNELPFGSLYLYFQNPYLSDYEGGNVKPKSSVTVNMFFSNGYSAIDWDVFAGSCCQGNTASPYIQEEHYTAGDAYVDTPDGVDYFESAGPVSIAYDAYSVMGPGISGSIKPGRLDMGSVSSPKKSSSQYYSTNLASFTQTHVKFKYTTDYSNYYTNHINGNGAGSEPGFYTFYTSTGGTTASLTLNPTDPYFFDHIENTRLGLNKADVYKPRLYNGRNIEWFSNFSLNQINATEPLVEDRNPAKGKIALYESAPYRIRDNNEMGGLAITGLDGNTYHFALPVGNYNETYAMNRVNNLNSTDFTSFLHKDINGYASSFLLTGITGPDYVDKNSNNFIDSEDYGYYVKFNYGNGTQNFWRFPYQGDDVKVKNNNTYSSNQSGYSETRYLNSIETRSHIALFSKSPRLDAKGTNGGVKSKLDKILLYKKSDLVGLTISGGAGRPNFPACTNTTSGGCDCDFRAELFSTPDQSSLEALAVKKISFNYNYALCKSTPNSSDPAKGKLTLKSVSFHKNVTKLMPDYEFEYEGEFGNDPNNVYNNAQDDFGFPQTSTWNLNKIKLPTGSNINVTYEKHDFQSVSGIAVNKTVGGGSRVKKISFTDGIQSFNKTYQYSDDYGNSYGVVSKVPEKSSLYSSINTNYPNHSHYDYPTTGVLYSRVIEKSGLLTSNNDFEEKIIYNYETPYFGMISQSSSVNPHSTELPVGSRHHLVSKEYNFHIQDNTSSIGTLKSVEIYDKSSILKSKTEWAYTSNPTNIAANTSIGKYTEGVYLSEHDESELEIYEQGYYRHSYDKRKHIKTTKLRLPTVLASTKIVSNGVSKLIKNEDWDFFTGSVIKSTETYPDIAKSLTTIIIPAYKIYPGMGLKSENPLNKNMLGQLYSSTSYINNDPNKVVDAFTQTWKNNWGYRELSSGTYSEYIPTNINELIFRKVAEYTWNGPLNTDGSYKNFQAYTSTGAKWVKNNEALLYDHYSKPLEQTDVNSNFSSIKFGYNNFYPISTSTFSNYSSSFHTSFEDLNAGWFGGEVSKGPSASSVTTESLLLPHTGSFMLKIPSSATPLTGAAYTYGASSTNYRGLEKGRTYRVSAWIHSSSDPSAKVFWSQGGNIVNYVEKGLSDAVSIIATVDNWSLIRFDVTLPATYTSGVGAANQITIGIKGGSSKASYFDDFRIQPVESSLTGMVYDSEGRIINILSKDNFFTLYEYNAKGQVAKVWQETPTNSVKKLVKEYKYHIQGE